MNWTRLIICAIGATTLTLVIGQFESFTMPLAQTWIACFIVLLAGVSLDDYLNQ